MSKMDKRTEPHVCTKEDPFEASRHKCATHPDAVLISQEYGIPGGDIITWRCPYCGLEFEEELQ